MPSLLLPMLILAIQAQAPSRAAAAADRFALDLPADDRAPAPSEPADVPKPAPGRPSLDTPIADLIADPRAKAILDRDLPGLSDDENLPKFKALSLRRLAPLSGGQVTDALLAKVGDDLAALDGTAPPPPAAKPVESRRGLPVGR